MVSWIKLNGNTFTNSQIQLHSAVQHAMVSNNRTDYSFYPQIIIETEDPEYASRVMSDITIDHNTGVLAGARGYFLEIDGDRFQSIITITNNLFAAPQFEPGGSNGAASVYVNAATAGSIAYDNNNVWAPATGISHLTPAAVNFIGTGPAITNFLSAAQWNALPNVGTDFFEKLTASSGKLTTAGNGTFIGAILPADRGLIASSPNRLRSQPQPPPLSNRKAAAVVCVFHQPVACSPWVRTVSKLTG